MTLEVPFWGLILALIPIIYLAIRREAVMGNKIENLTKAINGIPGKVTALQVEVTYLKENLTETKQDLKDLKHILGH